LVAPTAVKYAEPEGKSGAYPHAVLVLAPSSPDATISVTPIVERMMASLFTEVK